MRVGWLADNPGFVGGAELTQREFRNAAPVDVEVVDCPPGRVEPGLDRYVVHNCATYSLSDLVAMNGAPIVKYVNDMWPDGDPAVRDELLSRASRFIFTSPLHSSRFRFRDRINGEVELIPPPVDVKRFRKARNGHGDGNVCVGRMAYGKGLEALEDYGEPVDVFSSVPVPSRGSVSYRGSVQPEQVASVLARYRTFVFLPRALEPFGRGVVEAWAVGLNLVVNGRVGARFWIEESPEMIEDASERFWEVVK